MSVYRIIGGDVGTEIVFIVRQWPVGSTPIPGVAAPILNIAAASNLELILIPPGGSSVTKAATLYTNGSDGAMTCTTVSGDIPTVTASELWQVQASFTLGGWSGMSEPDTFWVDP